jgi:hypothetical protein
MKPIAFEGHNVVYAKDQPEYLPLPVLKTVDGLVISCWSLSFAERVKVFFSGKIYFMTLTFNKPLQPQRPSVDMPEEVIRVLVNQDAVNEASEGGRE